MIPGRVTCWEVTREYSSSGAESHRNHEIWKWTRGMLMADIGQKEGMRSSEKGMDKSNIQKILTSIIYRTMYTTNQIWVAKILLKDRE
jgi:hypothetical protein